MIAKETGKPIWETRTEAAAMAGKIATSIRAYHDRTGEATREAAGNQIVLRHRPLGVMAVFSHITSLVTYRMATLFPALRGTQLCSNHLSKRLGLAS